MKRGTKSCLQSESQSASFTLLGFAIAFSWTIYVEAGGSSSRDGCVCLRLGSTELIEGRCTSNDVYEFHILGGGGGGAN